MCLMIRKYVTYEYFFCIITASDHSFVVHDVCVSSLFAHTAKRKRTPALF